MLSSSIVFSSELLVGSDCHKDNRNKCDAYSDLKSRSPSSYYNIGRDESGHFKDVYYIVTTLCSSLVLGLTITCGMKYLWKKNVG